MIDDIKRSESEVVQVVMHGINEPTHGFGAAPLSKITSG
jgi:hypothetical protein